MATIDEQIAEQNKRINNFSSDFEIFVNNLLNAATVNYDIANIQAFSIPADAAVDALPAVEAEFIEVIAAENRVTNQSLRAQYERDYEFALKSFKDDLKQMSRDKTIEERGKALFELAQKAKQVSNIRKYFKSLGRKGGALTRL